MFNPQRYEHVYGIQLLDDIHNIFPEILYDGTRFVETSLVPYIQQRVGDVFEEIYAQNRAHFRMFRRRPAAPLAPQAPPVPTPPTYVPTRYTFPVSPLRQTATATAQQPQTQTQTRIPLRPSVLRQQQSAQPSQQQQNSDVVTSAFLTSLFGDLSALSGGGAMFTMFDMEDVPVAPTAAQLEAASILSTTAPPEDIVCPICQDHEGATPVWRILRHCEHRFHQACLDRWFRRHVHCPVCRHDIRSV